jgi:glutamate synthase (NADPH/NADH) small chain
MDPREVQQLEELCVQDDPPLCQAACPLHVDARGMLLAITRGDFRAAASTYGKKVPLPGILSRICDQPCRADCKREQAGDAINIGLLERSCADYAGFVPEVPRRGLPKQERVAVVGGGLSGLSAALMLAKKGYGVTIFEATGRLGGELRAQPTDLLPPEIIDQDISLLDEYEIDIRTGVRLGRDITISDLRGQYGAVYLAMGSQAAADPVCKPLADSTDPVTLTTSMDAVFCGGGARRHVEEYSPVWSMSDGCRAAVSIDRFLKRESLAYNREKEGPHRSRLYTSLVGVEPRSAVPPAGPGIGYRREEAVAEAARCLQCQCLECVKACTYLKHFNEYPGKCIRKVTKNIISIPGKSYRTYTRFIDACSLCGLCGVVCPTNLNMAVVNSQARRIMCDKGFMPPAIHDFAVRDMESSNSTLYTMARNQPAHSSSAYLFFPGCQLAASAPHNVDKTYRYLVERLNGGVGLMLRCCGAPAAWAGRQNLFQDVLGAFLQQWTEMGRPRVILACPTCSLMFKESLPHVPATSLWEIIDKEGFPDGAPEGGGQRLALHDSCTARSAPEIQESVRRVVQKLGYQVEELPYNREMTKCCGYGGLMYQVNQGLTDEVIKARIEESATDYLTYCTNCRDFFADKAKPSYHVLDLVFAGHPGDVPARAGPTLSQRRDNRRRLAQNMLAELWGEVMPEMQEHMGVNVRVPADLAARMEREFILIEDVQRVIYQAETTGNKLHVPATGRFIAHYQPSIITYWVEYAPAADGYEVFNAYSHRMRIVKDVCRDES